MSTRPARSPREARHRLVQHRQTLLAAARPRERDPQGGLHVNLALGAA